LEKEGKTLPKLMANLIFTRGMVNLAKAKVPNPHQETLPSSILTPLARLSLEKRFGGNIKEDIHQIFKKRKAKFGLVEGP